MFLKTLIRFAALYPLGCLLLLLQQPEAARATAFEFSNVQVDARANLYSAGYTTLAGDGTGILPPSVSFAEQSPSVLRFSSVTGEVGCNFHLSNGPDGTCFPGYGTRILSTNALGRIRVDEQNMFLAGVFLTPNGPGTVRPDPLFYNVYAGGLTTRDLTYSPLVNQVFFIGDGLTGTGSGEQQQFYIPQPASRLYLGFADSFDSYPGFYTDNVGSLTATFSITNTPEAPTTLSCGLTFLVAAAILRNKVRSQKISTSSR